MRERYRRFARDEAPGRSELYRRWAEAVADDPSLQSILERIPATRRHPPLVFAVTRILGSPLAAVERWRRFVLAHADAVVEECSSRRLQTNEPLRLAALLPALAEIDGPIALLELGASAGLCLYPDRYSYRFVAADGGMRAVLDPVEGPSPVVLTSEVRAEMPTLRMPQVTWRAGIDLDPLDARDERDRAWLESLVWPGETQRAQRITAALDIVRSDPPIMVRGDAREQLSALAASAPAAATLVITTPGMLVHLARVERTALIAEIRELTVRRSARWVTIDAPQTHDAWRPAVDPELWSGFVVALDGRVRAAADPLGRWWEWRAS